MLDRPYEFKTTFWQDFSIAERFGVGAIRDAFNLVFEESKGNYVYLTELVLILNWKIWEWYKKNDDVGMLYNELWGKAREYALETLDGEEFEYYFNVTD